jgi:hypothetical protein
VAGKRGRNYVGGQLVCDRCYHLVIFLPRFPTCPLVTHDLSGLKKSEYILATRLGSARSFTMLLSPRHTDNGG